MVKIIKCFLILLLLFNISCDNQNIQQDLSFSIKELAIEINENYLNSYIEWHPYSQDGKTMLVAYNPMVHSLDLFDLEKLEPVEQIYLEREGPNALGNIQGVFLHSRDSIFLFERGKLHIANTNGEVFTTFNLYDYIRNESKGDPNINLYFKLKYFPENHSIPFSVFHHNTSFLDAQRLPIVSEFNIHRKEFTALPIYNEEVYNKNKGKMGFITYQGFMDKMNDNYIYNYQYDPNIYSFNSNKISSSNLKVDFSPLLDEGEIDIHAINNTHYLTPLPDPWSNVIYRINWQKPRISNGDYVDKTMSLSVFDSNLNYIMDYNLPDYTYQIHNYFVWKEGLYLNAAHPKNKEQKENIIVFHVYSPKF